MHKARENGAGSRVFLEQVGLQQAVKCANDWLPNSVTTHMGPTSGGGNGRVRDKGSTREAEGFNVASAVLSPCGAESKPEKLFKKDLSKI